MRPYGGSIIQLLIISNCSLSRVLKSKVNPSTPPIVIFLGCFLPDRYWSVTGITCQLAHGQPTERYSADDERRMRRSRQDC